MEHNEIYNLLIRYMDGETTADEAIVMEELLKNDAYWKNEFQLLSTLNLHIPTSINYSIDAQTDKNWDTLKSQIEQASQPKSIKLWPSLLKYAAAASIIFMAAWFLYRPFANEFAGFENGKTYKTGAKEIKKISLPDGSQITLNENSSLSIDNDFNKTNRLVELNGEAFFDIAKNADKPFITKTKNTYTKVLGTSFEIEANNDNQVSVSLFEGKVEFQSDHKKTILTPGDKLNYTLETKKIVKQTLKFMTKDTWVNGLSFKDAQLSDIAKQIENHYKISISIPDSRKEERYTVSFEGLDLNASLRLLEELTDSKISKKDSDYILNP